MRAAYMLVAVMAAVSIAPASAASQDDDKTKVICKTIKQTGSRLPGQRMCMTKAEWDLQRRESRKTAEDTINGGGPPPPKG